MLICVEGKRVGNKKNIVVDTIANSWEEISNKEILSDSLFWFGTQHSIDKKCFLSVLEICNEEIFIDVPKKYLESYSFIVNERQEYWKLIVPKHEYKKLLDKFVVDIITITNSDKFIAALKYYDTVFQTHNVVFKSLQSANINRELFYKLVLENASDSTLKTFTPNKETGLSKVPVYNRTKTKTGRCGIESGANLLALKKEFRSVLKSRFDQGQIVYIDYKSLEPRTILFAVNHPEYSNDDIYGWLKTKFEQRFNKDLDVSRDTLKRFVNSYFYGAGKQSLDTLFLSKEKSTNFIEIIDENCLIKPLLEKLGNEFKEKGFITNLFGRPLCSITESLLLPHFIQSTAVDITLYGFTNIINLIQKNDILESMMIPLFILHDALLIDCDPKILKHLPLLLKKAEQPIPQQPTKTFKANFETLC